MSSSSDITNSVSVVKSLKNKDLFRTQGYINGQFVDSGDGTTFDVHNPALLPKKEAYIGTVQNMTHDDYEKAIATADTAFHSFKKTTGHYRSELLKKLADIYLENKEDLATLVCLENGKAYPDALGEVVYAASFFQWFSHVAATDSGTIIESEIPNSRILTIKQPVGVCGILTPWNFPAAMITRKIGAYIAAGCTGVIKPADQTPFSALALGYIQELAGVPKGVINILPAAESGPVGKQLCEHPTIRKISFTGSTNVGKILMNQSASTLKKVSFELGGNAPFIVFDDADVDAAVEGLLSIKYTNSGQTCICANRAFIQEGIYDEFAEKFVKKVKEATKVGNGLEKGVTQGPLIKKESIDKVKSHIDDAVSKGAKLVLGGKPRKDLGDLFHELSILTGVTTDMLIIKEETFGPVCPLVKFSSEEDVVKKANNVEVGLAGYFFTRDISRAFRVGEDLEVGMVGINTASVSEAALPFGGVKFSGFGREGSIFGVDDYTSRKAMVIAL